MSGIVSGGSSPYSVQWQTDHGYSGIAALATSGSSASSESWNTGTISLVNGENTISVTAYDSAKGSATQTETVSLVPAPPPSGPAAHFRSDLFSGYQRYHDKCRHHVFSRNRSGRGRYRESHLANLDRRNRHGYGDQSLARVIGPVAEGQQHDPDPRVRFRGEQRLGGTGRGEKLLARGDKSTFSRLRGASDMNKRFISALIAYAILIGLAFVLLHGLALKAVLVLFAGLLAKTAVALKLDR